MSLSPELTDWDRQPALTSELISAIEQIFDRENIRRGRETITFPNVYYLMAKTPQILSEAGMPKIPLVACFPDKRYCEDPVRAMFYDWDHQTGILLGAQEAKGLPGGFIYLPPLRHESGHLILRVSERPKGEGALIQEDIPIGHLPNSRFGYLLLVLNKEKADYLSARAFSLVVGQANLTNPDIETPAPRPPVVETEPRVSPETLPDNVFRDRIREVAKTLVPIRDDDIDRNRLGQWQGSLKQTQTPVYVTADDRQVIVRCQCLRETVEAEKINQAFASREWERIFSSVAPSTQRLSINFTRGPLGWTGVMGVRLGNKETSSPAEINLGQVAELVSGLVPLVANPPADLAPKVSGPPVRVIQTDARLHKDEYVPHAPEKDVPATPDQEIKPVDTLTPEAKKLANLITADSRAALQMITEKCRGLKFVMPNHKFDVYHYVGYFQGFFPIMAYVLDNNRGVTFIWNLPGVDCLGSAPASSKEKLHLMLEVRDNGHWSALFLERLPEDKVILTPEAIAQFVDQLQSAPTEKRKVIIGPGSTHKGRSRRHW